MQLLHDYLLEERAEIMDNGIRLRAIGSTEKLPGMVRQPLEALMTESQGNTEMTLTLALSYDSRESIVEAARTAARSGEITVESIERCLPTAELPPLDLLIRTSGELRISNFLLWEAAYAELYFTDVLWPDFRRAHLYQALEAYHARERRFGLTGAQVQGRAVG